ncbi:MAG: hypothetical protein AAB074_08595 [Planctomycetota bacterium]
MKGPLRFLWNPGEAAAEGGRVATAASACAAAAFAQGVALKLIVERPEFSHKDAPPVSASWWAVGASVACVALAAWFIRATLIELVLDLKRKQRNMRATLRATALISALAAAIGATWGFAAVAVVPKGAPPVIEFKEGDPATKATVAPTLWVLTVPFAAIWAWRAAWEGRAAAKLYGKPAWLAILVSLAAGLAALLLAFIAVPSAAAQYDRISHAFSR